jgi:hypothetical protein
MKRSQALGRLQRTLMAVAQRRRVEEAARGRWPLPEDLALHLWLYAEGLAGPTCVDRDDFE